MADISFSNVTFIRRNHTNHLTYMILVKTVLGDIKSHICCIPVEDSLVENIVLCPIPAKIMQERNFTKWKPKETLRLHILCLVIVMCVQLWVLGLADKVPSSENFPGDLDVFFAQISVGSQSLELWMNMEGIPQSETSQRVFEKGGGEQGGGCPRLYNLPKRLYLGNCL